MNGGSRGVNVCAACRKDVAPGDGSEFALFVDGIWNGVQDSPCSPWIFVCGVCQAAVPDGVVLWPVADRGSETVRPVVAGREGQDVKS